jgi:tetratricopeptide (TPR) repeat protein
MWNLLPLAVCAALAIGQGTPAAVPKPVPRDKPTINQGQVDEGLPAYYFLLGRYLEGENKIDAAVDAFKKAIELEPASAEPRAELAALYARADRAREAVEAADAALKVDPQNREANRILGSVLAALAEQKQKLRPGDDLASYAPRAIAALEIARADGAGDLSIDLALSRLYLDADRPGDAVPLLRRIVLEQPQYAEGSILLAEAQEAAGMPDAAVETLRTLLTDQPKFFRGRVQLAELYEHQRKWADAADAWASVQKLNSRNAEIAARHATALLNAGRPAEAMPVIRDALALTPSDVRLTFMLAQAQRDSGDLAAAEVTARALQTAHPDDVRTKFLLGQMLDARGRKAEALATYKEAAALAPDNTTVLFQYGAALDRNGQRAEAQKIFRDLIAKDPLDANALNYLGYMMAEQRTSLDDAVTLIQRALKVEPDNPSYKDSLGWAYFQQGKLDLADAPLSDAARSLPKDSVIQEHLGDLRLKQNRRAEALEAWERALTGDGESVDKARIQKKIDAARKR